MVNIRRSRAVPILAALLAAVVALTVVGEDPAEARKKKRKKVNKIVFASNGGDNNAEGDLEIFSIDPAGTSLKQLTSDAVDDIEPALSPSGTKVAFTKQVGSDQEIYVMNADGSNEKNITNQPGSNQSAPAWSPDGKKIAYTEGRFYETEIYVMNADGSNKRNWTNFAQASVPDYRPAYSPDGKRIAFTSMGEALGDFEIYDMSASTPSSGPPSWRNLTHNDDQDYRPKYSPDGKTIVYDSTPSCFFSTPGDFEVMKMNADGSGTPTNLTNNTTDDLHSDFSPSGTMIVYMKLPQGNTSGSCTSSPNANLGELYTMNSDGTNPKPIPNIDNQFINQSPDWGRQLQRR
jgi:Tol biopolymer transport system component